MLTISNPSDSLILIPIAGLATHVSPIYHRNYMDSSWMLPVVLPFSEGPRSCIGQQFALTENVCVLASIVRRYEILVPQHLLSLSHEEQKKEMLQWVALMTTTPSHPHVRLRRRS